MSFDPLCSTDGDMNLGEEINVVRYNFTGGQPECPVCHVSGPMKVYEYGVRWACGRIQELPALPKKKATYAPGGHSTARRRAAA